MTHLEMKHGLVVFFNHLHWLLPIETLLTLVGALYCHFLLPMFTFVLYMPSCVYSIVSSNATSIMHGKSRQDKALSKVEKILNEIGCHGGNVQIRVDKKISGVNHEVAQKVSMSGAKARRFLQRPLSKIPRFLTPSTSTKKWELWKDLCGCTTTESSNADLALL